MQVRISAREEAWFRRGDPERDRFASTVYAARLLLLAVEEGQNVALLARRLGCPPAFVARCARRLLESGVWKGGRTVAAWLEQGPDHPAFWYDVAVAEGTMCRRLRPSGEFEWAQAGAWLRPYEARGRTEPDGWIGHPGRAPDAGPATERIPTGPPARLQPEAPAEWLRSMGYPRAREPDPIRALFPDAQWLG
jgi:hypothetical protein